MPNLTLIDVFVTYAVPIGVLVALLGLAVTIIVQWPTLQQYRLVRLMGGSAVAVVYALAVLGAYRLLGAVEGFIATYSHHPSAFSMLVIALFATLGALYVLINTDWRI